LYPPSNKYLPEIDISRVIILEEIFSAPEIEEISISLRFIREFVFIGDVSFKLRIFAIFMNVE
jgi:hypothetical protein